MTLTAPYRMLGHSTAWANARRYDAAARLSAEQYRADRGAFFQSVHGTHHRFRRPPGRCPHRRHDQVPPRLDAGSVRAAAGAGAGALIQPPDPPPWPGPRTTDRSGRPGAGTRSVDLPAAFGEIRRLTARPARAKPVAPVSYDLVQGAGMQQNCAVAVTNSA